MIDRNRFDRVQREIEAGLVFTAAAIEYQMDNPARAKMCRGEAEDCFQASLDLIRRGGFTGDDLPEFEPLLTQLREQLNLLRTRIVAPAAAA